MNNIFGVTRKKLESYFESIGEKKFKATQVFEWLYIHKIWDITKFSNIKKEIQEKLMNDFSTDFIKIEIVEEGPLVKKFLFRLLDGEKIEAVLMEHDYGLSVCVSSQVGCNMGCRFCESGRLKKIRNLETYEIVEQILLIGIILFLISFVGAWSDNAKLICKSRLLNSLIFGTNPQVETVICLAPIARPLASLIILIKSIMLS